MEYTVKTEEAGRRVRDILRRSMGVSYTAMKSAKWNNRLWLNGESVFTDAKVQAGDRVRIDWAEESPAYRPRRCDLPLEIPWEDEYLMAVVKPAPLASQSSRNHPDDSLENAVYTYFGCPEDFVYRPVNRLDKGTSGLMLIATHAAVPAAVPGHDRRGSGSKAGNHQPADCQGAGRHREAHRLPGRETV